MTLTLLLASACGPPDSAAATTGDSETDTDTSGTDTDTAGLPTSGAGDDGGLACVPGKVEACPCVGGGQGVQACEPGGQGFGACECPDTSVGTVPGEATSDEPSDATTTASGDDTSTSGDDTGETGTTSDEPPACADPDDAPGLEADALEVADQGCDDRPKELGGVLAGPADVDWYRYHASGAMGCFGQPEAVHNLDASEYLRVCVFVDCDQGAPDFDCDGDAQMNESPDGLPGCCNDGPISFTLNCMGSPQESAQMYVRLDMAGADACIDYAVEYSFDGGI